MQIQFEFDAEGVFDQPIRPVRIRKRKQIRKKWITLTNTKRKLLKHPSTHTAAVMAEMERFDLAHAVVPLSPAYYHQVFIAEQRGERVSVPRVSFQRLKFER